MVPSQGRKFSCDKTVRMHQHSLLFNYMLNWHNINYLWQILILPNTKTERDTFHARGYEDSSLSRYPFLPTWSIPIKIPARHLVDIDHLVLKFPGSGCRPRRESPLLKKNSCQKLTLSTFQTNHNTALTSSGLKE